MVRMPCSLDKRHSGAEHKSGEIVRRFWHAIAVVVVLGIGALALLVWPWKRCTQVGCADGPRVVFTSAAGGWSSGTYTFRVKTPDKEYACVVKWPEHLASFFGPEARPRCSPHADFWLWPDDIARLRNQGEDAAFRNHQQVRWSARAVGFGLPPSIEVSVERDGRQLLHGRHTLTYVNRYANGPDCGVTCRSAFVTVTVPMSLNDAASIPLSRNSYGHFKRECCHETESTAVFAGVGRSRRC